MIDSEVRGRFGKAGKPDRDAVEEPGRIETLEYETRDYLHASKDPVAKHALVYTPYGYDPDNKDVLYDVLFLMHDMRQGADFLFQWEEGMLPGLFDDMIAKGDMKPMIVVTPTYLLNDDATLSYTEEAQATQTFAKELRNDIMPALMNRYCVYGSTPAQDALKNQDEGRLEEGMQDVNMVGHEVNFPETLGAGGVEQLGAGEDALRAHYAFGGFSFGAVTTWYVFLDCLDLFKWYLPICGDCWVSGINGGLTRSMQTTERLAQVVRRQGFPPQDFCIHLATGTYDPMHKAVERQARSMRKRDHVFTPNSFFYHVKTKGKHDYAEMVELLCDILTQIF